jgi:hypothetical protein
MTSGNTSKGDKSVMSPAPSSNTGNLSKAAVLLQDQLQYGRTAGDREKS